MPRWKSNRPDLSQRSAARHLLGVVQRENPQILYSVIFRGCQDIPRASKTPGTPIVKADFIQTLSKSSQNAISANFKFWLNKLRKAHPGIARLRPEIQERRLVIERPNPKLES
jgi:hypothetical protein